MRLVCPNCGAQYEVDDRVIPETGRDVQCSACGHGWYQMPSGHDEAAEEPQAAEADDGYEGEGEPVAAEDAAPEPEPPQPQPQPQPQRRPVDDGVRSILKEEAQRELEARAAEQKREPAPVETQPELGLDQGLSEEEERRRIARERIARMRGIDEAAEEDAAPAPEAAAAAAAVAPAPKPAKAVPRRELFPDIEEINSTLDSHNPELAKARAASEPSAASGFGRGFIAVVFIAALLLVIYLVAPRLAVSVPALEPVLTLFVNAVNAGRDALDQILQQITSKIEGSAAGQ